MVNLENGKGRSDCVATWAVQFSAISRPAIRDRLIGDATASAGERHEVNGRLVVVDSVKELADQTSLRTSPPKPRATAKKDSPLQTDSALRRLHFRAGQWQGDLLAAWLT